MKIKQFVTQSRKNMHLTQKEFAAMCGVAANTVSRWESGKYEVPNKIIEYLFDKHEIDVICSHCMGSGMVKRLENIRQVTN